MKLNCGNSHAFEVSFCWIKFADVFNGLDDGILSKVICQMEIMIWERTFSNGAEIRKLLGNKIKIRFHGVWFLGLNIKQL